MANESKTYIGIDLGTENIGYAATDENYKILKVGKKSALGVYVYSDANLQANTAVDRRVFRTSRRRLDRRAFRILLLQELFNKAMAEKDPTFFLKLKENDLNLGDKSTNNKFSLFNDSDYTDRDFYKQYKTIYHLRADLMENGTDDIRKLYLAIHHIVKYRGHFLFSDEMGGAREVAPIIEELNESIVERNTEIYEIEGANTFGEFAIDRVAELKDLFSNSKLKKKEKIEKTIEILSGKDKYQKMIVEAAFGYKIDVRKLFGDSQYEKGDVESFSFDDAYEEIEGGLAAKLSANDFKIVSLMKAFYDYRALTSMLKGRESVSVAMIEKYDKHCADLKKLKQFYKDFAPQQYDDMFGVKVDEKKKVNDKHYNYTAYIGGGRPNGKEKFCNGRLGFTATKADFYKFAKESIGKINNPEAEEIKAEILSDIENDNFMPKVVSKENSLLPYQLNLLELKRILDKAKENPQFAWLNESDKYGDVSDKIMSLLTFRIPYYVGPLKIYRSDKENKFGWAVRKAAGRVTPWNFKDLIDPEASNEKFIKKMLNKCTYLRDQFALPMNSITYSEFVALSELNKLKLNDELLPIDLKQEIWQEVYKNNSNQPSVKRILAFLKAKGYVNPKLSGYDVNIKGNLKSYHILKGIIGDKVDSDRAMAERLILLMTIHNESKILAGAIKKEFEGKLSEEEINRLKGIRFNGWGRLSMALLEGSAEDGIYLSDAQGERRSILSIMKDTTLNIMEIMNSKYFDFEKELVDYNIKHNIAVNSNITFEDVKEMYCSPSVKRSVWQAFSLIKTLVKETGRTPDKIFIEVTREANEDNKGKRTKSRKENLLALYKEVYKEVDKLKSDIYRDDLDRFKNDVEHRENNYFNPEKMYLYFLQLGRCAYSGKKIDLDELNSCDIDHIVPQALTKDDSLDNKVLVFGTLNKNKSDTYPVPSEYREKSKGLWKFWLDSKLISQAKYDKLMRVVPVSEEEKEKFINRQLVETNQMALLVRDLLDRYFNADEKRTEIVLSKAGNVSDFRKVFKIVKSRDVNDYHHAIDAYLNVVVGNVLNEKFNHNRDFKNLHDSNKAVPVKEDATANGQGDNADENAGEKKKTNKFLKTFFSSVWSDRENRYIWSDYKGLRSINLVKEQIDNADVSVAKKTVRNKGELFKSTVFKADKWNAEDIKDTAKYTMQESKVDESGKELNPKSDSFNYGYRKTSGTAYFVIVDSEDKKGNKKRSIEAISIYDDKRIMSGKITLEEAVKNKGLIDAKLATITGLNDPILKMGTLMELDGARLRLAGMTDDRIIFHNANQLKASKDIERYIKEMSVINEKALKPAATANKEDKDAIVAEQYVLLEEDKRRRQKENNVEVVFITKEENLRVFDFIVDKMNHKPYSAIPGYAPSIKLLNNCRDLFIGFGLHEQVSILLKLLDAFACRAPGADTSDLYYINPFGKTIKGSTGSFKITHSKFIEDKKFKCILQSKTGLKERIIKLYD